jgi:4-hydroxybenzoate polyprenyltransferase
MLFDYWTTDYNFERQVIIYGYVFMAFILNWIREIIKDMEDIAGDHKFGRKSLPIVLGVGISKLFIALLFILFVVFFTGATAYFFHYTFTILLQIVAFAFAYYLINAEEKLDFLKLSTFIKLIMFVGLLIPLFIF